MDGSKRTRDSSNTSRNGSKRTRNSSNSSTKQQKAVRNFEPTNIMGGTNISEGVQRFQVVSEIFVPGGPDISGVQIFRDRPMETSDTSRHITEKLGMTGIYVITAKKK